MPTSGSYFDSPPSVPPSSEIPDQEQSATDSLRAMLFVATSLGKFLTALGHNFGIRRPDASPFDDELYRLVIQAIACPGPKTLISTLYFLLEAIFGSQASITSSSGRPWRVFEVIPNETIIEIPFDLIAASNETASYFHGWSAVVLSGASTTVFSCPGDARVAAVTLVGLGASAFISGAWEERAISAAVYNATTDTTQITVAAFSGAPSGGTPFFITVPGDLVSSFRGDYISPIYYVTGTSTATGVNSFTDSGLALTPNQFAGFFLRLANGAIYYPIISHTATVFTLGANGNIPPSGDYAVVASPVDANEESDTVTTPPHADRVYVQGEGKIEIARQYVNEVLKASGVVVRFETV